MIVINIEFLAGIVGSSCNSLSDCLGTNVVGTNQSPGSFFQTTNCSNNTCQYLI